MHRVTSADKAFRSPNFSASGTKAEGGIEASVRCQRASASSITGLRSRTRTMGW
jgi:hypothetical protein